MNVAGATRATYAPDVQGSIVASLATGSLTSAAPIRTEAFQRSRARPPDAQNRSSRAGRSPV
jgi:hypothetical protein